MSTDSAGLLPIHLDYLHDRGINSQCLRGQYFSCGENLAIRYLDPHGAPYKDSRGNDYIVERLFPTSQPKFKAPFNSGSRPYFSPLMPEGYLNNISIPLVFIEGPVKVDACYQAIPSMPSVFLFIRGTKTTTRTDHTARINSWERDAQKHRRQRVLKSWLTSSLKATLSVGCSITSAIAGGCAEKQHGYISTKHAPSSEKIWLTLTAPTCLPARFNCLSRSQLMPLPEAGRAMRLVQYAS
uniref:hypothetical protein n=1 Tax=Synechococcus sp. UW106 TaxID=368495 RepID=UPI0010BE1C63|nr:hypothetical protein [Synechococcus sp. UW106]